MATCSPSKTNWPFTLRQLQMALRPQVQMVFISSMVWASSSRRVEPGKPRSEKSAQKQEAQDAVYAFVGAPERVVLHCDRAVLDDVLDRFGTDIQIFERDEQTFTAVLTTPPRGVRFWALQYLSFVEVAEPAWLRQEIVESIARNQYTNRKGG